MAAVTEDELQKKREKVEKLREQVAAAEAQQAERLQEADNALQAKALDVETARLEASLRAAKEAAKVSTYKDGVAGPMASLDDQLEAAKAAAEAPVGPVDTNAGASDDNDNEKKKEA